MELFETLKQFKKINSDAAYQEKSKRMILAQTPMQPLKSLWGTRRTLAAIFESGIAVALTVFFILIIVGKFPGQSTVTPVQFSVIDPSTLKAEAQAVDIQIQLAQIAYTESTTTAASSQQTTAANAAGGPKLTAHAMMMAAASSTGAHASSTTESSTVSVDQALLELSQ